MILFLISITLEFMPAVPRSSVINVRLMRQETRSWSLCLYSGVKVQDSTDICFVSQSLLCGKKTHEGNEWANREFRWGSHGSLRCSHTATHSFLGKVLIAVAKTNIIITVTHHSKVCYFLMLGLFTKVAFI